MGTIYQCLKRDGRYTPPMMTVVHEAESSGEAVRWLENNGGGIFRNLLHNFDCGVAAKGRLMKIKTADLIGPALDWAVAKCEGLNPNSDPKVRRQYVGYSGFAEANGFGYAIKHYSTDWSQGGPIIEREGITLRCGLHGWDAELEEFDAISHGPTALITGMRCLVASRLGDEVDVPDELV